MADWACGIDVSQYQGVIDWPAVRASGVLFALIRASRCTPEGKLEKDTHFDRNWAGAGEAGVLRGSYHYLRGLANGQARFFVEAVGGVRPELGFWADLEAAGLTAVKCGSFLRATDVRTGARTGVYTRATFFDRYGVPAWAPVRSLWVAHFGAEAPAVPRAWDGIGWTFWQYSDTGRVPGITGNVDLDYFAGTADELYAWQGGPSARKEEVIREVRAALERAQDGIAMAQAALGRL